MQVRRNVRWIVGGVGVTCLLVFIVLPLLSRHDGKSVPIVSPSPIVADSFDHQKPSVTQSTPVPSNKPVLKEEPLSEPLVSSQEVPPPVPPPDERALELHRRAADDLNAKLREATKRLYAGVFQQLHLPADLQEKVIDILTQQQKQLEQQAFEATQSGTLPAPPSPAEARAQLAQQDQQLRSALGDAGFEQFNQYRASIPDRSMIDAMNQKGANLTESQSEQLLQILTDARKQIISQAGATQNFDSMSPQQAITIMQEQQTLLQQTVGNRVQNILTPDQARILQTAFSQFSLGPKVR